MSSTSTGAHARSTAVQHREQVERSLVALEDALAAPAAGRVAEWTTMVTRCLHDLRGEFARHVEITEGSDGLYDEIVGVAPELSRALDALRTDHIDIERGIRASLSGMGDRSTVDPDGWVEERRAACRDVIDRLVAHRQRGIDLTFRAYNDDQGGHG